MNAMAPQWLEGCRLRACWFEPTFHKHVGKLCAGAQIHAEAPHYSENAFRPWRWWRSPSRRSGASIRLTRYGAIFPTNTRLALPSTSSAAGRRCAHGWTTRPPPRLTSTPWRAPTRKLARRARRRVALLVLLRPRGGDGFRQRLVFRAPGRQDEVDRLQKRARRRNFLALEPRVHEHARGVQVPGKLIHAAKDLAGAMQHARMDRDARQGRDRAVVSSDINVFHAPNGQAGAGLAQVTGCPNCA